MPIKVWQLKDDNNQKIIFSQQISELPASELRLRVFRAQDYAIEFRDCAKDDNDPDDLGIFSEQLPSRHMQYHCLTSFC